MEAGHVWYPGDSSLKGNTRRVLKHGARLTKKELQYDWPSRPAMLGQSSVLLLPNKIIALARSGIG